MNRCVRDTSTLPVGTWSSALDKSFRHSLSVRPAAYLAISLLRPSGGGGGGERETNFFGSKFASDSSTPLSKGLLLLYHTFKSMPKAKF